jgi:hypothetical protein
MRKLFGHGTPRQAADAVFVAVIAVLWIAFEKIARRWQTLFGTLLPRPMVHRGAADLAA